MSEVTELDLLNIPLDQIDVSAASIYSDEVWQPVFARLRKEAPVHYCADSPVGPYWSVSSHEFIKQVDTNHKAFSSAEGIAIIDPRNREEQESDVPIENFIAMDPPTHDQQRATVSPSVAPTNLANLEPLIRERAADILDNLPVGEVFNWVDEVSVELTARMLATLFDFPYEDRRKLIYWSDITTNTPELTGVEMDMEQRQKDLMECAQVFTQLWHERAAAEPKFDLISMLAHGKNTGDMINNPMLYLGNVLLLIVGGNDTTRNSISGGVIALNEFPEEYDKLRANPGLIPNMVSEMIRWQTPVIHMRRTALEDTELGGQTIKAGDRVVMWYLSGNRDESVFPDADRLIIDRPNARKHVAFGFGVHRCMGNRLAEMQLRVLWEEIIARFERIELAGEVKRLPNNFIRGIGEVPVRVIPKS
ncbi:MAG: cytochrome P450 [Pseudomonadales bacterium]